MTRRSKLKLGVGAILSLIVVMSTSPSWARTLQEILSSKKIRLGTIPYPPMTQLDSRTGKYSGLWIDGPKFMFEQAGIEAEFVETKWATFPSALQSNQFDVFVGGSFATPQLHIRSTYRNFFHAHERWMTSGFRCARDV